MWEQSFLMAEIILAGISQRHWFKAVVSQQPMELLLQISCNCEKFLSCNLEATDASRVRRREIVLPKAVWQTLLLVVAVV